MIERISLKTIYHVNNIVMKKDLFLNTTVRHYIITTVCNEIIELNNAKVLSNDPFLRKHK